MTLFVLRLLRNFHIELFCLNLSNLIVRGLELHPHEREGGDDV